MRLKRPFAVPSAFRVEIHKYVVYILQRSDCMPKYSDKAKYCDVDIGALHLERTAPLPLSGRPSSYCCGMLVCKHFEPQML